MRVIVDTNVFVSGLISTSGPPAKIVDALLRGSIIPVMSRATLAELQDVLQRPRLQPLFARAGVSPSRFVADLVQVAQIVRPVPLEASIRDEKDRPFLELAGSRPAVDFIITGDKDFVERRYAEVPVISATLFVQTALQ